LRDDFHCVSIVTLSLSVFWENSPEKVGFNKNLFEENKLENDQSLYCVTPILSLIKTVLGSKYTKFR